MREIDIDSFAGGGGASIGIEAATGRHVDVAINHDAEAIAMHRANHAQYSDHSDACKKMRTAIANIVRSDKD